MRGKWTGRTETVTRYFAADGDLLIAVRQRPDTLFWALSDFTGPTLKTEQFANRSDAEASAARKFRKV